MKKIFAIVLVVVLMATLIPGVALADKPPAGEKGNGLPKDMGKSFNFNVIAVPEDSHNGWDDDSGGNGKRIFINRTGTTSVYVHGDNVTQSLEILDRNGTDGAVGWGKGDPGIVLPYEGVPGDGGRWACAIYVRVLGPANDAANKIDGVLKYYEGGAYYLLKSFTLQRDMNNKFRLKNNDLLDDDYQDILWEFSISGRVIKYLQNILLVLRKLRHDCRKTQLFSFIPTARTHLEVHRVCTYNIQSFPQFSTQTLVITSDKMNLFFCIPSPPVELLSCSLVERYHNVVRKQLATKSDGGR